MLGHFGGDWFALGCGPRGVFWAGPRRRRRQWFESGDMKYVILKLLKDKPRHGYEVMKELEDQLRGCYTPSAGTVYPTRSEEHTSELQSRSDLVCRLLLEKKKKNKNAYLFNRFHNSIAV